jgi:predicted transcriptional regulator
MNKNIRTMNAAEIKLDLFRRIDSLPKNDLEKVYDKFLALLNLTSEYRLSETERQAIEEALEDSERGDVFSHEEVMNEAKRKYPNLKFR